VSADLLSVSLRLSRGAAFAMAADVQVPATGISVLFGASGSGKTTLLRAIAGLEPAAHGRVAMGSRVWQDSSAGLWVPTWQRNVGYVFQEASLFEHLDVAGNVAYGLRWQRAGETSSGAGNQAGLDMLADLLGIRALMRRRIDTLSGGERQRVAIARALAVRPALLLLDEPLASLDFARRDEIIDWLLELRERTATPMLYVTHSLEELARLADRAVVIAGGRVAACDVPEAALRQAGLHVAADRMVRLREV